jgi:hypothetical protein
VLHVLAYNFAGRHVVIIIIINHLFLRITLRNQSSLKASIAVA